MIRFPLIRIASVIETLHRRLEQFDRSFQQLTGFLSLARKSEVEQNAAIFVPDLDEHFRKTLSGEYPRGIFVSNCRVFQKSRDFGFIPGVMRLHSKSVAQFEIRLGPALRIIFPIHAAQSCPESISGDRMATERLPVAFIFRLF